MAELFENLREFIPDWANKHLEEDLIEVVDVFEQQQRKKTHFLSPVRHKR